MNLFINENRLRDIENKPVVTKGEKEVGLINYTSKKKKKGKKAR